jgi:hypothetical protein
MLGGEAGPQLLSAEELDAMVQARDEERAQGFVPKETAPSIEAVPDAPHGDTRDHLGAIVSLDSDTHHESHDE